MGDLLIWATDGKCYNNTRFDVREQAETELYLIYENPETTDVLDNITMMDVIPPEAGEAKVTPSEEKSRINEQRKAHEDSIRDAYVATFPTKENYKNLLKPSKNLSDEQAWEIIHKAEGNYKEIAKFINNHADEDLTEMVTITCPCLEEDKNGEYHSVGGGENKTYFLYDYLHTFSDKDMRDITAETLEAHWCKPTVPAIM